MMPEQKGEHKENKQQAANNQKEEKTVTLKEQEYLKLKADAQRAGEYWDKLLRLQADFENTRKRLDKEKQDFFKFANEDIILERSGAHRRVVAV